MTEIEQKALALVNEVNAERSRPEWRYLERFKDTASEALCHAIEQHEAFRREVSDAIESCALTPAAEARLSRFIIPQPDPLVEAFSDIGTIDPNGAAKDLRAALAARGLKIVEDK